LPALSGQATPPLALPRPVLQLPDADQATDCWRPGRPALLALQAFASGREYLVADLFPLLKQIPERPPENPAP
jgi:hypothetical protein